MNVKYQMDGKGVLKGDDTRMVHYSRFFDALGDNDATRQALTIASEILASYEDMRIYRYDVPGEPRLIGSITQSS